MTLTDYTRQTIAEAKSNRKVHIKGECHVKYLGADRDKLPDISEALELASKKAGKEHQSELAQYPKSDKLTAEAFYKEFFNVKIIPKEVDIDTIFILKFAQDYASQREIVSDEDIEKWAESNFPNELLENEINEHEKEIVELFKSGLSVGAKWM
jgi:hypothetical protein